MSLSLQKGSRLNLSKDLGLQYAIIGLGWDPRKFDSQEDFDLDATAFVLKEDGTPFGKVLTLPAETDGWVCYYNQQDVGNGAVRHLLGDNQNGGGAGDDEQIGIDFTKLPPEASRIAIVVTIHEAITRKQNFGRVDSAYVRVLDKNEVEKAKADLSDDASTSTAQMFVEFKKNDQGHWVMQVIGEGFNKGLEDFFKAFKVPGF